MIRGVRTGKRGHRNAIRHRTGRRRRFRCGGRRESEEGSPISRIRDHIRRHTNPSVFFASGALVLVFCIVGVVEPERFKAAALSLRSAIGTHFGWFYVLSAALFLGLALWLMMSRFGRLRLGPDSARPEFGFPSWIAMIFTAGMGIGLVTYGVYEPVMHTGDPFVSESGEPATTAMRYTLFHWGLHPWAIYVVPGLALGYFCFRKGLPMRPASALYPLIGDRINGWIGNLIDILAVFTTLVGIATSLGLGTRQIGSGLSGAFGLHDGAALHLLIIAAVTAVAVASVLAGLDRGIRRMAVLTLWTAGALLAVTAALGPRLFMVGAAVSGLGEYLQNIVEMSLTFVPPGTDPQAQEFSSRWTLFYWGWWVSWSPFVGMFLARISYGRTVREFIAACLFAPLTISVLWFGVFGGAGIFHRLQDGAPAAGGPGAALFGLLHALGLPEPAYAALVVFAIIVLAAFYITSADSASLVVDMLTNGGDPHPVRLQRVFWSSLIGLIAVVLLVAGGDAAVQALEAAAVCAALPFCAVLVLMAVSLVTAVRRDGADAAEGSPEPRRPRTMRTDPSGPPDAPRRRQ